jgi:hypothetical protein
MGVKEDESSSGHVWAVRFHHVMARSRLARFETYEPFIFLIFIFVSGRGKPWIPNRQIQGHACTWAWP